MRTLLVLAALLVGVAFAQPRAWRDVNFGMTDAQVTEQLAKYPDVTAGFMGLTHEVSFGPWPYTITELWPDNLLGRIQFESLPVTASLFDSALQTYLQALVDVISGAHGPASDVRRVEFLDSRPGITWTHSWGVDADGVRRRVGISQRDFRYSAILWIEDAARVDAWQAARQQRTDEDIEDAADDF